MIHAQRFDGLGIPPQRTTGKTARMTRAPRRREWLRATTRPGGWPTLELVSALEYDELLQAAGAAGARIEALRPVVEMFADEPARRSVERNRQALRAQARAVLGAHASGSPVPDAPSPEPESAPEPVIRVHSWPR
jgi:hypothetical protein